MLDALIWVAFGCGVACLFMAGVFMAVLWYYWLRPQRRGS